MATRSGVFIYDKNRLKGIYVHYDGYLYRVGKTLLKNYNNTNLVNQLISLGSLRSIGDTIDTCDAFNEKEWFRSPRISGDNWREDMMNYLDEFWDLEYIYIWDTNKNEWLVYFYSNDYGNDIVPLKDVITESIRTKSRKSKPIKEGKSMIKESLVNDNYSWGDIALIASEYYDTGCTNDEIRADLQDCEDSSYVNRLIEYVNIIREVMEDEHRLSSCEIAKCLKYYRESDIWDMFYNKLSDSRIEGIIECIEELNENVKMRNRVKKVNIKESFERDRLYDELCLTLTDYEEGIDDANDLYNMLVKIQNNWETVITAQND